MVNFSRVGTSLCLLVSAVAGIPLDVNDTESIKSAASTVAYGLMTYYKGNDSGQIPGLLPTAPEHYYWWECGAMMGTLIDYWQLTGDETYNADVMQALQFQVGPHADFMPPNQTFDMGNDDQAFWAMSAMNAAESNFENPPEGDPSWLSLVQAVFNEQTSRWDNTTCGGGLRWQVYPVSGYNLKNSISNGGLIQISARLARYTRDPLYAEWPYKIWTWMEQVGLIDEYYNVYDNVDVTSNCSQATMSRDQWTYNAGTMLMGAAYMYNYTDGAEIWYNRTKGLMNSIAFDYFPASDGGVMKDICEEFNACDVDQRSFKAYLSRWMAVATQMAPFTHETFYPLLTRSAEAAAAQCNGNGPSAPPGQTCGLKWYLNGTWDGTNGVGQQMDALEIILSTLYKDIPGGNGSAQSPLVPLTNSTGGTSTSNPHAGFNESSVVPGAIITPATTADRAGAWFLTVLILLGSVVALYFMWSDFLEPREEPAALTRNEKGKQSESSLASGGAQAAAQDGAQGGAVAAATIHDEEKATSRHLSKVSMREVVRDGSPCSGGSQRVQGV